MSENPDRFVVGVALAEGSWPWTDEGTLIVVRGLMADLAAAEAEVARLRSAILRRDAALAVFDPDLVTDQQLLDVALGEQS
jgi:hypothetical protein